MPEAPEGWYTNPANPAEELYWLGDGWSNARRSVAGPNSSPAPREAPSTPTMRTADGIHQPAVPIAPAATATATMSPETPVKKLTDYGKRSLFVGIGALVFAVVPGLSFIAFVPALGAIIFALMAMVRSKNYKGKALAGLIMGAVALLLSMIVSTAAVGSPTADDASSNEPIAAEEVAEEQVDLSEEDAAAAEAEAAAQAEEDAAVAAEKAAEEAAAAEAAAAEAAAAAAAEEAARGTVAQQNAKGSAESYLDYSAFSRTGLIDQLEFEGFSTEDATWAVDRVSVDWNEQAAKSAKSYLDYSSFSRSGLVDQLIFEGFTPDEANYGVSQTGL